MLTNNEAEEPPAKRRSRALWICVAVAFVVLISAWTTLILIAVNNQPPAFEP
ncbi:MAG: hypothetical protein ACFB21_12570 [Opitutales bacterium]